MTFCNGSIEPYLAIIKQVPKEMRERNWHLKEHFIIDK